MDKLLRVVLVTDAVVLLALGALLLTLPATMLRVFGYGDVPASVNFIVSTWGAVMLATGIGYVLAAREPHLSRAWVWFGLWRNALEAAVALKFVADGTVDLRQSWPGVLIPVWFALFYALFMLLGRRLAIPEAAHGR